MSTINAQTKAENETAEEEVSQAPTPDVEPKAPEEVEEPEEESTEESKEEAPETEKKVQKKGFENRVRELVKEKKEAQEQARTLQERLAELTRREDEGKSPQQYEPQIEPGQEITPEQYKQDLMNTAKSLVELEVKKSEAINRIDREASEVVRLYPELDPDSDDFNRELSDTVTDAVEAHIRANPYSASVKNFAAKLMKTYRGSVTKEVGEANEQLAKQVSSAALKPTSVSKKEKKASEMTIKELEDKLGVMQT